MYWKCGAKKKILSVNTWNKSYMNCGNEMKMKKKPGKKKKKKIRTSTEFEPVTSRLPVRCSTNWDMKPLTLGAGQNQPSASWRKLTLCAQISPKSQATECKFARRLRWSRRRRATTTLSSNIQTKLWNLSAKKKQILAVHLDGSLERKQIASFIFGF